MKFFVALVLCLGAAAASDEYLSEVGEACKARSDIYTCGKYEVLKYINNAAVGVPSTSVAGPLSIVNVAGEPAGQGVFPNARQLAGDSEINKFLKFVFRQVNTFMTSRSVAVAMPDSARLVDVDDDTNEIVSEARGKKKKVHALIPLLTLFKLVKIKVLLTVVLLSVLFIKKAIIVFALLAPSLLHTLKMCKQPHYSHHEVEDYGSSGYGFGGHTAHGHSGYDKAWGASRAYNAHKPQ